MKPDLLPLLVCPWCRSRFLQDPHASGGPGALDCTRCGRRFPIVNGIPRFVDVPDDEVAQRTQASFGYEWTHFGDWQRSGETNFNDYFGGLDLATVRGAVVLDAGCGMGRHARQLAIHAGRIVAVDFSRAIDQAARNTAPMTNVDCVQADLLALPLADASFDFVYSLGVLHHLRDTEAALRALVNKLKPGGRLRVYLYWKRSGWSGRLLQVVSGIRRLTTRLPFPLLRGLCWVLSAGLYMTVIVPYRVLAALGVRRHGEWPLYVYSKYPFNVLYNDQFDRFSAPLEKRYDAGEVRALLEGAGLKDIQVRPCFGWIADGTRPA
jgi:SAM-dependent methyltransferase